MVPSYGSIMDSDSGVGTRLDRSRNKSSEAADEPLLSHDPSSIESEPTVSPISSRTKWVVLLLVGLLSLFFETGNAIRNAPLIAVYEEKLCADLRIQLDGKRDRQSCSQIPEVERSLALVLGVSQFIESIPMILLSALYGSLADRYGRRVILVVGYLGLILSSTWNTAIAAIAPSLPLRLVWVGPLFTIVGGGSGVPISILMASAADVVSPEQKVTAFAYIHAVAMTAVMLGSLLSSVMMPRVGNFPPLLTGLALMCTCLVLSVLVPDTRSPILSKSDVSTDESVLHASLPLRTSGDSVIAIQPTKAASALGSVYQSFQDLWQVHGAFPLLAAGFISMLGQQVQVLILQYMPSRFDITIANANWFNILNSGINLLVLIVLLPLSSAFLLLRRHKTFRKDMILAYISSSIFVIGALILGVAPTIPVAILGLSIFSMGVGLSSLLRSIFVELFPPEDAAFAITLMSAFKSVGNSLSGPMYFGAFTLSLSRHDILRGLPFFVSAICFTIVLYALAAVRQPIRRLT